MLQLTRGNFSQRLLPLFIYFILAVQQNGIASCPKEQNGLQILRKFAPAVTLMTCVQEVTSSDLSRDTGSPSGGFLWLSSVPRDEISASD
jgi:hypothetical protein